MKPKNAQPKFPVSAVMITHNEAINIRRTLSQLSWCDEIIVVDSFSSDGTDRIAKDMNCRVIRRVFESYGEQKSFAIALSRNDWVICLDADEYLTSELVEEIKQEMEQPENIQAFAFAIQSGFQKTTIQIRQGKQPAGC